MSRIRRIGYALSDKQTPNTVRQAFRLREETLKVVNSANEFASTSRRITKRAAFTVVLRSLEKTKGLPFSLREHMALKELSTYINLAQHNKNATFTHNHTDLLPVSHPRSTRLNSLSASALREARARWYSDDSRITDERAKTVLASAFTSLPGSAEHLYYTSLLSGFPQGTVPSDALLAAFGDGNSSAARRFRAMRQRRDRKGRFAYEGGGLRALIRRGSRVFSLTGRTVAEGDGDNIQIELPDGRIAEVPASRGEFVKAVLPTPDGYSPKEVKPSISEEKDVIDEKNIKFAEAPNGWQKVQEREQDNVWEDGAFVVDITQNEDGSKKFSVYNKDDMQNPIGEYKNWADVQDSLRDKEETLAKPVARLPEKQEQAPAAEKPKSFVFKYPDGAYKIKLGTEYDPQGRVDEESSDFTDDPAELAQKFDPRDIKAALEEAVIPQGENENAFGYGNLGFNRGDEMVEANALYNALKEQDEDADMELARIYDDALGGTANQDALRDFRKAPEKVTGETPKLEESFKRVIEEGAPDVAPAAEEPAFDEAQMDQVPLPPLLEGLGDAEMKQFMDTKDHTPFLPKNDDIEPPVGYNKLNPAPFTNWREVTPENPDPVLPEGFSDNPVFLAQSVPQEELEKELRRALEPGNEMPGYGAIKLKNEDGEDFVANVPGEAIRDALQLNGVDTNKLIEDIYNEGEAQRVDEDLARQILDQEEGQVAEMPSVLDMLEEEEALADKYEEEGDGMPRGDAQAVAEAEMRRKYGKSAMDALLELDPKEGARLLDLRERKILGELDVPQGTVEVRKKTVRPELIQDFEVGALEEVPDGIAEYPKPADIAPADANAPYRIVSKVTDLQPGDITVGDHFVITEIGEKVPGTDRRKIKGYYPGHVEQDTKQWNEWREIEVIRGAQAPEKGDLPVLSKPKPQDFGKQKRGADGRWDFANEEDKANFLAAQAAYDAQLAEAKKGFIDPTSPSNQPHRTIVRAADLQPGDISADPKKGHFVIERIFTDENTKPGFVSIEGYYPGHVTQRKEWKVDTQIDVLRNVEAPAKGELPELHQPHLVVNGKWRPDKDPAKRAEYEKQIAELANVWQAPENLPVVENKEQKPEENKDIPDAVVVARPKPPRMIEMPAFQGDAAGLMREAGGDWNKFKELLADKNLVFFDFETTGVNEEDGNEPWQVAAVKIRNGEVVERINLFMNPGRSIADTYAGRDTDRVPNAVDADGNKLTDEFLAQQPTQEEAMRQLIEWMGPDYILGAQNMAFDDEVARRMADKFGIDYQPAGYIDTLPMAKDIYKDQPKENKPKTPKGRESYALGNLATHLGVELENWHAADADAEAAAKIFNALIDKAIELDAGKDLFDVDARNDEYVAKLDDYNIALANYETDIANYAAAKALKDGLEGKPLDVENLVALSKGVAGQDPDNVNIGPVGLEPEIPQAINEKVVLDFTPNADFPKGKMMLMPKDWALDDNNTVLLDREDARMRDLLPGDFMQSKDGEIVWQVVAVRAGEDFGLAPGRVKVYRRNVDTGEISTYEHWHGTRLDGVRRPINPAALNAPEGEKVFVANAPENPAEIEQKSEPGNVVYRNLIDIGGLADGYVRIRKNEEGRFEAIVGIVDNNDEAIFSFKEDYRTYEGAKAEAEAVLEERAKEFLAQKRDEAAQPEEARAKDVPISRGDIPADAGVAAQLIEVENLPNDLVGNISIKDVGEEQPKFEAESALQNAEGDVIAEQFSEHKNRAAAEKEGRDFIARAADAVQNPEPVEAPAAEPKKKELSEADKRVIKQNEWVEANAGRLAPLEANAVKPGDFFWNAFHKRYEEVLETKYIGFMNRYEFKVFNVKNGKEELRYFEADSPLRNMRRPGIEDQEVVIVDDKAAPRGGKRRDIKRKALEERIVAKEGRAMGGNFEKEGFYRDRNGDPVKPGDFVIHNNPEKAKKYGVGKVVRRVGAQVEEGKKVGGLGRAGVVYLDYVEVDFEDGSRRKFKTRMLIKQNAPEAEVERQQEEVLPPPPTPPFPRVGEEAPPALDVKFENIDNAEITDGLQKIRDAAENKNRRAGNATIERAVEAVDNFLRGLDINNPDKIRMDELDAAIRRFARKGYDQEASALEGLRDLIKPQVDKLQAEKIARIYADINNPLEVGLNDVDTLDFNNIVAVLDEIQNRLPAGERDGVGRRLGYARDYIERLKNSISDNDDLMENFDYDLIKEAVNYINEAGLQQNAPKFDNIKNRLNEVEAAVKGYRKKNRKPFGKKNMPEIDPIALAEQRVKNGDNKVTVQDFDHIKAGILDDEVFAVNSYLAPYKQELQDFFGTDGDKPLAALSADARQALSQYVSDEIRKISGVRDGDRKQSLANQYSKMLLALHDEKLAFNPNRSDLGPVGEALKDIDFNAVFQFGQSQATKKPKKLVINGQDTGFKIQKIGDGINQSYNYRLIHSDTGQIFYFKRERSLNTADAEFASNQLARALNIAGVPVVERHNNDAQVLIMTNAGDSLNYDKDPFVAGFAGQQYDDVASRAAIADMIGVAILDAVIYNTDRHTHNFLLGEVDRGNVGSNGREELQVLPIDHGFAQLFVQNVRVEEPVDYMSGRDGRDGGQINKALAKQLGAVTYKELIDMTVQQAIQAIERGDYLSNVTPRARQDIIDRLLTLKGIDADKWKTKLAKKL